MVSLVIINKDTSRLSKANKHQRKREIKEADNAINEPLPNYRFTLDLTMTNTILLGNKKISLHNPSEIIDKISDCYVSKFNFSEKKTSSQCK